MPINWNLDASSLTNIARYNFREIGQIMNDTKSFTLAAIRWESVYLGDFNQHYELLHVPNMGGYKFPLQAALHCNNTIIGLSGIDEIIYGKDVMIWKDFWRVTEPLIQEAKIHWKKYVEKIRKIHVVTQSEKNEMHEYLKIPLEKMNIIPHGVDHSFFKPSLNKDFTRKHILSELNIPNQKYFLHVGELNYLRKNQERIGEAFKIAKQKGLQHNLIIAGKHIDIIEKKLSKIPGIYILDWITNDQLLNLYQAADAFILPSIHEGFGMPLVEAMACGVPCISSKTHSPPQIISDAGILVDPYSESEIADAMLKLAKNENLLQSLSKKSLQQSKNFSWIKNAKEIFDLYQVNTKKQIDDFESKYSIAALRTLVTVCDIFPDEKQQLIYSLLRFDYYNLIHWAVEYGLDDPKCRDFLLPFQDWYKSQLEQSMKVQS